MTVDEQLAVMSTEQLRRGLQKGRDQLKVLPAIMFGGEGNYMADEYDAKGPPTAAYERWLHNFTDERERLLRLGIRDVENELTRRGEQP